jgi:hypothetical protein
MKVQTNLPTIASGLIASVMALSGTNSRAEEKPLLAIPGNVVYENKMTETPAKPWTTPKGTWVGEGGVVRGSEKPEDKHGAVMRLPNKLGDFVIEYEFKFEGAKSTSLSINAVKDHMARILITPTSVTVQKDDNDHQGPDKAVVFARVPFDGKPGTWHKVRMEMVGDTMLGKVDDFVAWGSNDLFKQDRMSPGFTVGGQSVDFRNLTIREATLNPAWSEVKAGLPAPGEKVTPPVARGAKAEAKKQDSAGSN